MIKQEQQSFSLKQKKWFGSAIILATFLCIMAWKIEMYSNLYPEHSNNGFYAGFYFLFSLEPKDVDTIIGGPVNKILQIL